MAQNTETIYKQMSFLKEVEEKETTAEEQFFSELHQDVLFLCAVRDEYWKYKNKGILTPNFIKHVHETFISFVKAYFIKFDILSSDNKYLENQEDNRLLGNLFYFYLFHLKKEGSENIVYEKMEEFLIKQKYFLKKISPIKKEKGEINNSEKQNQGHPIEQFFQEYTETQMVYFFTLIFDFSDECSIKCKDGFGKNYEEIFKICEMILIYLCRYVYFVCDESSIEDFRVNDTMVSALEDFVFSYTDYFRVKNSKLCLAKSILMKRVNVRRVIEDKNIREKVLKTYKF